MNLARSLLTLRYPLFVVAWATGMSGCAGSPPPAAAAPPARAVAGPACRFDATPGYAEALRDQAEAAVKRRRHGDAMSLFGRAADYEAACAAALVAKSANPQAKGAPAASDPHLFLGPALNYDDAAREAKLAHRVAEACAFAKLSHAMWEQAGGGIPDDVRLLRLKCLAEATPEPGAKHG